MDLEFLKALAPPTVYLIAVTVLWKALQAAQADYMRRMDDVLARYEKLLVANTEALTRIGEKLEEHDDPK